MKASEIIKELQKRIDLYGDCNVTFRTEDDDMVIGSVYFDEDADSIIISDFVF